MPEQPVAALELSGLWRRYRQGTGWLEVLRGADLTLLPGEAVALVGPSGSGKSTLLQTAGLLDTPDSGRVRIGGCDAGTANDAERTRLRRIHIGFVYQFHHLLPELSAIENVSVPLLIAGRGRAEAAERSQALLARLGLADRVHHRPSELSGGEQQRVAICRAVAGRPSLLLADEPIGNLDPETAMGVLAALLELVKVENLALLAVTHNLEMAARMNRVVAIRRGRLEPVL